MFSVHARSRIRPYAHGRPRIHARRLFPSVKHPLSMPVRTPTLVQAALHGSHTDLSGKVIKGASFTFAGMALRTLITLGSVAILARLLPVSYTHLRAHETGRNL